MRVSWAVTILLFAIPLPCPGAAAQDEADTPSERLKKELVLWRSRKELCATMREPLKKYLIDKDVKEGNLFQPSHAELQIRKIHEQDEQLATWNPADAQELAAYHTAADEMFNVLLQIRDVAKQRIAARQKSEAAKANRAPARAGAAQFSQARSFSVDCSTPRFNHDVAALQLKLANQAKTSFNPGCIGADMADLEGSLRESWTQVEVKLRTVSDRLIPPLLADGYVRAFETDKLIQKWTRTEVHEAPSILLAECRDPLRIREVKYEVVDAFGAKRIGSVAILRNPQNVWVPSKENETRGGFYALHSTEGSK